MINTPVLWVHGDGLSPRSPLFTQHPTAPALWVWDEPLLETTQISLKRIVFIYECLLELPVEIRRGQVTTEILAFAQQYQADGLITTFSPSPRFQAIVAEVRVVLPVMVLPVEPFLNYKGFLDLKRFSRYWKVAQRLVLNQD